MERIVEPEWLDALPPDHHRARRSRADLRRVNFLMGHVAILERLWRDWAPPPEPCSLVELGAGDGTFSLRLARRLAPRCPVRTVTLVDWQESIGAETLSAFHRLGCTAEVIVEDVFDWLKNAPRCAVMIANLFLHHFAGAELSRLLALAADRTEFFLACEPRRSPSNLLGSRLLGVIGCNAVTRHDAVVSVRAGFSGKEISALWPQPGWMTTERAAGLFSHCFAARRRGQALPDALAGPET